MLSINSFLNLPWNLTQPLECKSSKPVFNPEKFKPTDDLIEISKKLISLLEFFESKIDPKFIDTQVATFNIQLYDFFEEKKSDPTLRAPHYLHFFWLYIALRPFKIATFPNFIPFEFETNSQPYWDPRNNHSETFLSSYIPREREMLISDLEWIKMLRSCTFGKISVKDEEFLYKNLLYYKKFLFSILSLPPNTYIDGPHVGIDLFWHSHILSQHYSADTLKFGFQKPPSHYPYNLHDLLWTNQYINPKNQILSPQITARKHFQEVFGERLELSLIFEDESAADPLEVLPKEVFLLICERFEFNDLSYCLQVSKKWKSVISEISYWKNFFDQITQMESHISLKVLHNITPLQRVKENMQNIRYSPKYHSDQKININKPEEDKKFLNYFANRYTCENLSYLKQDFYFVLQFLEDRKKLHELRLLGDITNLPDYDPKAKNIFFFHYQNYLEKFSHFEDILLNVNESKRNACCCVI